MRRMTAISVTVAPLLLLLQLALKQPTFHLHPSTSRQLSTLKTFVSKLFHYLLLDQKLKQNHPTLTTLAGCIVIIILVVKVWLLPAIRRWKGGQFDNPFTFTLLLLFDCYQKVVCIVCECGNQIFIYNKPGGTQPTLKMKNIKLKLRSKSTYRYFLTIKSVEQG